MLVIDSTSNKTDIFPWKYFFYILKLNIFILSIPTAIFLIQSNKIKNILKDHLANESLLQSINHNFFETNIVVLLSFILICIFNVTLLMKPLKKSLNLLKIFSDKLPIDKNLELIYKNDEWERVMASLELSNKILEKNTKKLNLEYEKTSTLIESISKPIVSFDSDGYYLFSNSFFNEIYQKIFPNYDVKSLNIYSLFASSDISETSKNSLKNNKTSFIKNTQLSDSEDTIYNISFYPIRDISNKQNNHGLIIFFYDVTEENKTSQMKSDFIANISHEIRTPITSIKGYAQIISKYLKSEGTEQHISQEKLQNYVKKIDSSTNKLVLLFEDILNLSIIESNYKLKKSSIDLEEMFDSTIESIQLKYPDYKVIINKNLSIKNIFADSKLFQQVLNNIIENAFKYCHSPLELSINARQLNNEVKIEFYDNGPGIPKELKSRVFERFFRVDNARSNTIAGTGLGLSIVKHIILRHKGDINLESQHGDGTKFQIYLPNIDKLS